MRELAMFVLGILGIATILAIFALGWANKLYLKQKQLDWIKLQNNNDRSRVLTRAVAKAANRMNLSPTDVGAILGFSYLEASALLEGAFYIHENTKAWELSSYFIKLYSSLVKIMGEDDSMIESWIKSPNLAFNQQIPLEHIKSIAGLIHVCEYLTRGE